MKKKARKHKPIYQDFAKKIAQMTTCSSHQIQIAMTELGGCLKDCS